MKAIKTHNKYGMMWDIAKDYALYAELFKQREDLPKAREKLSKAIETFKECGAYCVFRRIVTTHSATN